MATGRCLRDCVTGMLVSDDIDVWGGNEMATGRCLRDCITGMFVTVDIYNSERFEPR